MPEEREKMQAVRNEERRASGHDSYSAPEVIRLTGVSYRQLDYWDRTGLLAPSIMAANGSGTQRLYSPADLRVVTVTKLLLDAGLSLQRIRDLASALAEVPIEGEAVLVIGDTGLVVTHTAKELVAAVMNGEVSHVVRFGAPK